MTGLVFVFVFCVFGVLDQRPTKPVAWWEGGQILGGRDEVAGGTWLACSRGGRVAFLTNVLELHTVPEAKSRGDLPVLFLEVKFYTYPSPLPDESLPDKKTRFISYFINLVAGSLLMSLHGMTAEQKDSQGVCRGADYRGPSIQWV